MTRYLLERAVPCLGAVLLLGLATWAGSPVPALQSADEVLQRSVAYHDPEGLWSSGSFRFEIAGTRPINGPTLTAITIDNEAGRFHYERDRYGQVIEATVTGDECWTRLDGSSDLTEQQIERFNLSCEDMKETRNYHVFLYGLPMKLADEGAIVDPQATPAEFDGEEVLQVRVTYDPEVGTDTWYFYFDPTTYALVGYRFYHDESTNDGEYIVLSREVEGGGLRLPKVRSWFMNADDRLLGTDRIQSIERLSRDR